MCINRPLFKKIYDEGKTIIKYSESIEIKNKEARLDKAYDNMLNKEDFEYQEFYGIVHELRTYNFLVYNGYHITAQNDKHIGPDFFCDELGYIECVCITKGESNTDNRIYADMRLSNDSDRYMAALSRISSVIIDKKKKYDGYLSHDIKYKEKPLIIAVNTSIFSNESHSSLMINLMLMDWQHFFEQFLNRHLFSIFNW